MCEWMSQNTRTMPGRSKRIGLRAPGGVAPEIEAPRLRQREDVVVRAIVVGKVDRRADRHRQQVRDERLVPLVHRRRGRRRGPRTRPWARSRSRRPRAGAPSTSRTGPSPRSPADGRRSVSERQPRQFDASADGHAPRLRRPGRRQRRQQHRGRQRRRPTAASGVRTTASPGAPAASRRAPRRACDGRVARMPARSGSASPTRRRRLRAASPARPSRLRRSVPTMSLKVRRSTRVAAVMPGANRSGPRRRSRSSAAARSMGVGPTAGSGQRAVTSSARTRMWPIEYSPSAPHVC